MAVEPAPAARVPSRRRSPADARAELRAWYLLSLRPRLARAVSGGALTDGEHDALDRQVRELLDLPLRDGQEAA